MSSNKPTLTSPSFSHYLQNQNYDVYFSRGKIGTKLPGNLKYKELLYENCEAYNTTESRYERDMIAENILTTMKENFRAKFWVMKRRESIEGRLDSTSTPSKNLFLGYSSTTTTKSRTSHRRCNYNTSNVRSSNDPTSTSCLGENEERFCRTINGTSSTSYAYHGAGKVPEQQGEEGEKGVIINPRTPPAFSAAAAALNEGMKVAMIQNQCSHPTGGESPQHDNESAASSALLGNHDSKQTTDKNDKKVATDIHAPTGVGGRSTTSRDGSTTTKITNLRDDGAGGGGGITTTTSPGDEQENHCNSEIDKRSWFTTSASKRENIDDEHSRSAVSQQATTTYDHSAATSTTITGRGVQQQQPDEFISLAARLLLPTAPNTCSTTKNNDASSFYEHPPGMNDREDREWIELRLRSKILRKIKQGMRDLYHRMKKQGGEH